MALAQKKGMTYSQNGLLVNSPGTANQIQLGHVLSTLSFPSSIRTDTTKLAFWSWNASLNNFSALMKDGGGTKFASSYSSGTFIPDIPGLTFPGKSVYGNYVRMGKVVYVHGYFSWSTGNPTGTGATNITGLPFAAVNDTPCITRTEGLYFDGLPSIVVNAGATTLRPSQIFSNNSNPGTMGYTYFTAASTQGFGKIWFICTYLTN